MYDYNFDSCTSRQHRRLIEEGHPQVPQHLKECLHSKNFACWFAEHVSKILNIKYNLNCRTSNIVSSSFFFYLFFFFTD